MAYVGGAAVAPISQTDAENIWISAGGDPAAASMAGAVAHAESSLVANNWNTADPYGGSFGLWQINGSHAADLVAAGLPNWQTDPLQNAKAAILISGNGKNWNPWGTVNPHNATTPTYLQYLPGSLSSAARAAGATSAPAAGATSAPAAGTTSAPIVAPAASAAPGFFGPVIDAANSIATEVFLGAAALALIGGGLAWLAASDPATRTVVAKAATATAA